jgi:hypothetical protein
MRTEIVIAVVDTGITHSSMPHGVRRWLYRNEDEIAGNGRDDDGNGLVDDVTGPSTGPASNGGYQARESSGHGHGMVLDVMRQLDAAEDVLGASSVAASVMPVSMSDGGYYANIVAAAKAGASIISLSHNLSYGQKAYISDLVKDYDTIVVTVDRDTAGSFHPDVGADKAFDNVIEVAMISEARTRGNVNVDLLEVGSSLNNQSESHAIANAAGKIGAIWGVNPSRSAAEVLEIVQASTSMDHDTIRSKGLSSEMGGRIDLDLAVRLAAGKEVGDVKGETETRDLNEMTADGGYMRATAGDDLVTLGADRAIVYGAGGDDVFVFIGRPGREHVIHDFSDGDAIDVDALTGGVEDRVRLQEASWGGETHTRVLVEDDDGAWAQVALLSGVDDMVKDDFLL